MSNGKCKCTTEPKELRQTKAIKTGDGNTEAHTTDFHFPPSQSLTCLQSQCQTVSSCWLATDSLALLFWSKGNLGRSECMSVWWARNSECWARNSDLSIELGYNRNSKLGIELLHWLAQGTRSVSVWALLPTSAKVWGSLISTHFNSGDPSWRVHGDYLWGKQGLERLTTPFFLACGARAGHPLALSWQMIIREELGNFQLTSGTRSPAMGWLPCRINLRAPCAVPRPSPCCWGQEPSMTWQKEPKLHPNVSPHGLRGLVKESRPTSQVWTSRLCIVSDSSPHQQQEAS